MIKGKLQECCQINWNRPPSWYLWKELYGWNDFQHCSCGVCVKKQKETNLNKCTKKSCSACQKKALAEKKFETLIKPKLKKRTILDDWKPSWSI